MAARSDVPGGGQKSGGALRVVIVVVLALVAVGVGALRMGFIHLPGSHEDDSMLARPQDSSGPVAAKPSAPGLPSTASPGSGESTKPLDIDAPAADPQKGEVEPGRPGASRRPGARTASLSGSSSPVVTAVTPDAPGKSPQMAHLDEHVTYQYNALGRRDPFQSLLTGEFVGNDVGGDAPPDPGGMKIVGIVWGATDQFAMVEDVRGNSYVLRKGDKLQNGYVEALRRDAVVVNVTADGQSQTVVIPFVRKGDGNAH